MNWYLLLKSSSLRIAMPHYLTECPHCHKEFGADLLWEKRGNDPSLVAYDLKGQEHPADWGLQHQSEVSYWRSREKFTCPACHGVWYATTKQEINPNFQSFPVEEGSSMAPVDGQYAESILA